MQDRIKELAHRLKLLEARQKAPHVNSKAVGRFVRNALWEPKEKPMDDNDQLVRTPDQESSGIGRCDDANV